MKIRKSLAGLAAGTLVATGVAVAAAPGAQAFGPAGALALGCDVVGISNTLAPWNSTHTLSVNGSTGGSIEAGVGSTIAVSYSYAAGPTQGGPTSIGRSQVVVELATAATGGTVVATQTSAWSTPVSVTGGSTFPGETYATSFTAPASGTYFARIKNVLFEGYLGGPPGVGVLAATVNCNGQLTFAGQAPATNPSTAPVPFAGTQFTTSNLNASVTSVVAGWGTRPSNTYTRAGDTINVTGSDWGTGPVTSVTVGGAAATNTLAIDGSGNLSGTITTPAGATAGVGNIVIDTAAKTYSIGITVLGAPTLAISGSPTSVSPGATLTVTGSNWDPGRAPVSLLQGDASNPVLIGGGPSANILSPSGAATVSASGVFNGTIVVTASPVSAAGLRLQGGQGTAGALTQSVVISLSSTSCIRQVGTDPVTTCTTQQNITGTVTAGSLRQDASGALINLGSIGTNVTAQHLTGAINSITVTDTRGGLSTFSLTAAMPAFTGSTSSATIANGNLAISGIDCAPAAGSASGITVGGSQTFAGTVTVCDSSSVTANSAGTKGGQWVATGNLDLTVPAFQAADVYNSVITFTLT